jgi:hypothetical protein
VSDAVEIPVIASGCGSLQHIADASVKVMSAALAPHLPFWPSGHGGENICGSAESVRLMD